MSRPKLMLFVGPPPPSAVTPQSCTIDQVDDAFQDFLGKEGHFPAASPTQPTDRVAWRSLPLHREPLRWGISQGHDIHDGSSWDHPHFFTTAEISSLDKPASRDWPEDDPNHQTDLLSQFCEQSLAVHEAFPTSQLEELGDTSRADTTAETSFASNMSLERSILELPGHLSDLEDIPPAPQILALNPQTVTLNIIVGIISIAQPRVIMTRWGKVMSLVEILVGDDTKSGFAVTFWLSGENSAGIDLGSLRRQDVVLMQNVALHTFRGKVYGQSLRKGLTKVSLLWTADGRGRYSSRALDNAGDPQRRKAALVKEWVLNFVGGNSRPREKGAAADGSFRKSWSQPPSDTQ